MVEFVVLVVLVVSVEAPVSDDPPVVEVSGVVEFEVPAPVLLVPFAVVELEFELPVDGEFELEFTLELVFDVVDVCGLALPVVCEVALTALVVGTVSGGAPEVSLLPLALPPQAAMATAAMMAAPHPARRRYLRLEIP